MVELWRRDPVKCIRELLGNPLFVKHMRYAPERQYTDTEGTERIYSNMETADWWWDVQVNTDSVTIPFLYTPYLPKAML